MKKFLKIIFYPFELIFLFLIYLYKFLISPLLPKSCRFIPTCSSYAVSALREWGLFYGIIIAVKRILRCNPRNKSDRFDPVPVNLKGENKWIF